MKVIGMRINTQPNYQFTKNGIYFCGKIKELIKELSVLSKQYNTLRDVINKNMH